MRARITPLIAVFAFLPSCKKASTPEQVAAAEEEIRKVAVEVSHTTRNLEGADTPGRSLALKDELDSLKANLLAIREKNKGKIPMDQSKQFADLTIKEERTRVDEAMKKIEQDYQESLRKIDDDTQKKFDRENSESLKKTMEDFDKPFRLPAE